MARPTVVIADDSVVARTLLKKALSQIDIDCVEASTGNEVIRALNAHKPDLLLLDISMPYPDGLTVLRKMRADAEFSNTLVVLCSVEDGPQTRAIADELQVSAYLTKPIRPFATATLVQQLLGVSQS